MPSVTLSPDAPQPMNVHTSVPQSVAAAISWELVLAHPDRPMPMGSEIARAARLAVNRLDPLLHGAALNEAMHAVGRRLAEDKVIDARSLAFTAIVIYLHTLTGEQP